MKKPAFMAAWRASVIGVGSLMLALAGCQDFESQSSLNVANGEVATEAKYDSTVYVKAYGKLVEGNGPSISSVGTVLDLGHTGYTTLVFSLADSFVPVTVKGQKVAAIPPLIDMDLELWLKSRSEDGEGSVIRLSGIGADDQGRMKNGTRVRVVGASVLRTSKPLPSKLRKYEFSMVADKHAEINEKYFDLAPLMVDGSNLRNGITSYIVFEIPHSLHPDLKHLKGLKVLSADRLAQVDSWTMVGFGATTHGGTEVRRNAAPAFLDPDHELSRWIAGTDAGDSLFVIGGTGLCSQDGGEDGKSFDTGATVMASIGDQAYFAGMGVRSELADGINKYSDYNCSVEKSRLRTMVVLPQADELNIK